MGTPGEHLVRQGDSGRREDFVRHADRELTNFVRITPVDRPKKLGPRWSTLGIGLPKILCSYAERDTRFELVTFGLGSRREMQSLRVLTSQMGPNVGQR